MTRSKVGLEADAAAGHLLAGVTITANTFAVAIMSAVVTSAANVDSIVQIYTASVGALGAMAGSAADGTATVAQVVTFTSGSAAGTYLVVNDATAGFQGASDLVINVTGLSGTIAAGDFVAF